MKHQWGAKLRFAVQVLTCRDRIEPCQLELGHEPLAVTHDYLADVRKQGEAKKAVTDADFIPKPKIVKTGTDGD